MPTNWRATACARALPTRPASAPGWVSWRRCAVEEAVMVNFLILPRRLRATRLWDGLVCGPGGRGDRQGVGQGRRLAAALLAAGACVAAAPAAAQTAAAPLHGEARAPAGEP